MRVPPCPALAHIIPTLPTLTDHIPSAGTNLKVVPHSEPCIRKTPATGGDLRGHNRRQLEKGNREGQGTKESSHVKHRYTHASARTGPVVVVFDGRVNLINSGSVQGWKPRDDIANVNLFRSVRMCG